MLEMQHSSSLQHIADRVKPDLSLAETEDSWERISNAIISLKVGCDNGVFTSTSEVVQVMRASHPPIIRSLASERTRLCLSTLDLVSTLTTVLEAEFEPLLPIFLPALLALCGRTNKVIVNRSRSCIIHIVEMTRLPSILPYFLQHLREKTTSLRLVAAEGTLSCLNCCNPPDLEKEARASDIEAIIRKTARDPNADVRKVSRKIFNSYKTLLPHRVERFTAPLTPTVRKYLEIKNIPKDIKKVPDTARTEHPLKQRLQIGTSTSANPQPATQRTQHTHLESTPKAVCENHQLSQKEGIATQKGKINSSLMLVRPTATHIRSNSERVGLIRRPAPLSESSSGGPSRVVPELSTSSHTASRLNHPKPTTTAPIRPLSKSGSSVSTNLNSIAVSGPRRVPLPIASQPKLSGKAPAVRVGLQQTPHATTSSTTLIGPPKIAPVKPLIPAAKAAQSRSLVRPTISQLARAKAPTLQKPTNNNDAKKPRWGQPAATKDKVLPPKSGSSRRPAPNVNAEPQSGAPALKDRNPPMAPSPLPESPVVPSPPPEATTATSNVIETVTSVTAEDDAASTTSATADPQAVVAIDIQTQDVGNPTLLVVGETEDAEKTVVVHSADNSLGLESPVRTPSQDNVLRWNLGDTKTPISALLTSIQQGFDFSPSSPLSPPQSYLLHPNTMQALSLEVV